MIGIAAAWGVALAFYANSCFDALFAAGLSVAGAIGLGVVFGVLVLTASRLYEARSRRGDGRLGPVLVRTAPLFLGLLGVWLLAAWGVVAVLSPPLAEEVALFAAAAQRDAAATWSLVLAAPFSVHYLGRLSSACGVCGQG